MVVNQKNVKRCQPVDQIRRIAMLRRSKKALTAPLRRLY
jgi:hypothetical protein